MSKFSYKDSFEYDVNNSVVGNIIHEKYNLLNEIHRTENSIITRVTCNKTERQFVLKAVKKRDDLIFELDMLKQINIEGINQIHEIYESMQFIYFVENFIEGSNLEKYVIENGVFDRDDAKQVVLKISEILNRLHNYSEKNIVFRDLKPSNVMIEPNGNITLIDVITIRETKDNQTQDTFLIGSKGYTAPEAYGFMQSSMISDIYSLGATFFFLLTGEQPANISSLSTYFDVNRGIPFQDIIKKATAFVPSDRFQNVEELVDALNKGRVKRSNFKPLLISTIVLLSIVSILYYQHINEPFDSSEVIDVEDIEISSLIKLDNKDFKFELYSDGLLKVYVNRENLNSEVSDFVNISVGTGYTPYSYEMIKNDIFISTTEKGYQLYNDEGFNSALDDRKSVMIVLFSKDGEPIAYFTTNDVLEYAEKIDFNELNPQLQPVDFFELADGIIFNNFKEYTLLKIDKEKVKKFSSVSIWNKHSPYAGKDIEKVQKKIEDGENIVLYTDEGIKSDYGISKTFLGDYWLIYLLDENNNIVSEYRTEGMYQISQPSLQIEKSIDVDEGVILHVLGTYAKLEIDQSKLMNVRYVGLYQQKQNFNDADKLVFKSSAKNGININEYTLNGVDIGYDDSGIFDNSFWYIILLDENKEVIKEYVIE